MRKSIVNVLAVMIIMALVTPVFSQGPESGFTLYSDPENKFYLQVPAGWIPADQKNDVVVFIIVATPDNNPVSSLNVQKIPVTFPGEEQPKEAIDLLTGQLLDSLAQGSDFKLVQDTYRQVNDRLMRIFDVQYTYNGRTLYQTNGVTYANGNLYAIIYTADASVYNSQIFVTAANSFNLMG